MSVNTPNKIFFIAIILVFLSNQVFAQTKSPMAEIEQIIRSSKGTVGVAIKDLSSGKKIIFNETVKFPMQSVYKFPLAMAVLDQVDKGKLSLDQKLLITKKDLLPDTWSPIREKYPEGNVELTLAEVLSYTVSQSDNNGCDILFRLVGGTANVQKYIHGLGVKDISIAATEEEMSRSWDVQFTNWCQPEATLRLLEILHRGSKLSKSSNDLLLKLMDETYLGPNRLRGLLPAGTSVAHRTGTSNTNEKGITAAVNDVGIITLPNGKKFAIVVFVSNTTDDLKTNENIIAKTAKVMWDSLINQTVERMDSNQIKQRSRMPVVYRAAETEKVKVRAVEHLRSAEFGKK